MDNDLRILRERIGAAHDGLDSSLGGGEETRGSAAMLARTTTVNTYPTTASAFYAVVPCDIDGAEQEGQAATYTPQAGTTCYALNLGTQVPPNGTMIVCHAVGGRFVFRYDG